MYEYIKVNATSYVNKILKKCGCNHFQKNEEKIVEALHPDSKSKLETSDGLTTESECKQIKTEE
eukprot:15365100-Ditylum_brightwellii.AAC.1